jgi:hypothetical protein
MKLDFRQQTPFIAGTLALVLASPAPDARPQGTEPPDADALVLQLRGLLPAALYTGPHSYLLKVALTDPSSNVRGFARIAIWKISAGTP